MTGPESFHMLNEEGSIVNGWNSPDFSRLWLYNLHYFNDLNAEDSPARSGWHCILVERWVSDNPPGEGIGWEAYPTSLRIVNWIKWFLSFDTAKSNWLHSLAVQVRYLEHRIEYHLLGNHLLANAKALIFAGLFFEGREADRWLAKGQKILRLELAEQVLADGGHFERSPMYHAIVLEDLLDVVNLYQLCDETTPAFMNDVINRMLNWLQVMTHPDGEIVLFNDAAFSVAAKADDLKVYAQQIGLEAEEFTRKHLHVLSQTGYVRCEHGEIVLFVDGAPIGPDYLPGHAHADTLSFELSINKHRIIVDSGTSTYENNFERLRQRSTPAHNTVTINGQDSSEVWGAFRVARRALPLSLTLNQQPDGFKIACSHDGYKRLPGKVIHHRVWQLSDNQLKVLDRVEGLFATAVSSYHFHPGLEVELDESGTGKIKVPDGTEISFFIVKGKGRLQSSTYHPEFNMSIKNCCLLVDFAGEEVEVVFYV